jgi:hypothetical protein
MAGRGTGRFGSVHVRGGKVAEKFSYVKGEGFDSGFRGGRHVWPAGILELLQVIGFEVARLMNVIST